MTAIERLASLCRRWGGELKLVTVPQFDRLFYTDYVDGGRMHTFGYYEAPASPNHGLNWDAKTIYVVPEYADAGSIIHEMGHVFLEDGSPSFGTDEWSWLGWEIVVARLMRCYRAWDLQNRNYSLGDDWIGDWGNLAPWEKRILSRERIRAAKKLGFLDRLGRPQSTRS